LLVIDGLEYNALLGSEAVSVRRYIDYPTWSGLYENVCKKSGKQEVAHVISSKVKLYAIFG
jgi:hypothetical protein